MKSRSVKHILNWFAFILLSSPVYSQTNNTRIFGDSEIQISEISTNSTYNDFGPSVIHDTLFYTTFHKKVNSKTDDKQIRKAFYDLYKVGIDKQGNPLSRPKQLAEFVNKFNDGPVSWCEKTGELFITLDSIDLKAKPGSTQNSLYKLRIVTEKKINGHWEQVEDFPYNNPDWSVGHPAINESGDTLVFSSDMPGGYGETDLYYSVRKGGKWGNPVNLGPQINTVGKEEFSFLTDQHLNGRFLIFASTGRCGFGGYDLYYTRFPFNNNEIAHFESPINTACDDFAMTIPADAEFGYLTSGRPGTGNDDIYRFTFKRNMKSERTTETERIARPERIVKPREQFRELYVFDKNNLRPISGVIVVSCNKQMYLTDSNGKIAKFPRFEGGCQVVANTFGYPEKNKILPPIAAYYDGMVRDTIWMEMIRNQKIILNNIYYDYDKWDILPESANELNILVEFMKENPEINVVLSSHTDDRGTEQYNLKLSQLRAQSAVDYIVSKGINRSKIKGKGYGKSQLINKCNDAQPCTPEQRRENRRTEIMIQDHLEEEQVKPVNVDYSNVQPEKEDNSTAKPEIVDNSNVKPVKVENSTVKQEKRDNPIVTPDKVDNSIVKPVKVDNSGVKPGKADNSIVEPDKADKSSIKPEKADNSIKPGKSDNSNVKPAIADNSIVKPEKVDNQGVKPDKADYSNVKPDHSSDNIPSKEKDLNSEKGSKAVNTATNVTKYYVILGSFPEKANASKFAQRLNNEGLNAEILESPKAVRVGIEYPTLEQARERLQFFRHTYSTCWILQVK